MTRGSQDIVERHGKIINRVKQSESPVKLPREGKPENKRLRTMHVERRITQDRSGNVNIPPKRQNAPQAKIDGNKGKTDCVRSQAMEKKKAANPIKERQLVLFGL